MNLIECLYGNRFVIIKDEISTISNHEQDIARFITNQAQFHNDYRVAILGPKRKSMLNLVMETIGKPSKSGHCELGNGATIEIATNDGTRGQNYNLIAVIGLSQMKQNDADDVMKILFPVWASTSCRVIVTSGINPFDELWAKTDSSVFHQYL